MTMITPSYLGETIEYSSLHACRSTLEDPTWSQIAVKVVGPQGRVVGLDLKAIDFKAPNARFYVMDAFQFDPIILENRQVACLLSDMAPNTTGIRNTDQARSYDLCDQVLNIAGQYLAPRGHLVLKMFEGPDAEKIAKRLNSMFSQVKRVKPEAVRKGSFETYFVGLTKGL